MAGIITGGTSGIAGIILRRCCGEYGGYSPHGVPCLRQAGAMTGNTNVLRDRSGTTPPRRPGQAPSIGMRDRFNRVMEKARSEDARAKKGLAAHHINRVWRYANMVITNKPSNCA
jgi:hypothetical protein